MFVCLNVKTLSAVFECVLVGQAMVGPRGHYLTVLGAPPYYTSWENCSIRVISLPHIRQKKFLYMRLEKSHYQLAKIELLMKAGSLLRILFAKNVIFSFVYLRSS